MSKKALLISGFIASAAVLWWLTNNSAESHIQNDRVQDTSTHTSHETKAPALNVQAPPAVGENGIDFNKRAPEIRSLHIMTNLLAQVVQPESSMDAAVALLKDLKQDPIVTRESNPYTGSMTMVRTNNPFPGTRNFHAQYFGDENGANSFVQHMSFEFRPGPNALDEALEAVTTNFPGVKEPTTTERGSIQYEIGGGYVVNVKKLTKEDINEPDPFQAYEAGDEGTVRVTLEINESHDDEAEGDFEE